MKKFSFILSCLLVLVSLISCGKEESTAVGRLNYNLDEYVKLGNYIGLQVEAPEEAKVTKETIQQQVDIALSNYAEYKETTAAAKEGDIVNIDYVGKMNGTAFAGGTASGTDLTLGSGMFIDGFEEELVGHKKGEKVAVNVTFPDPYPNNPDYAGKPAVFEVTVNSVSTLTLPAYTNEFVKNYYGYDTTAAFEEAIGEALAERYANLAESTLEENILKALIANCEILQYPTEEYNQMYTDYTQYYTYLAAQQGLELSEYINDVLGVSLSEYYDLIDTQIQLYLQQEMVITAIARKENITITEEEYQSEGLQYAIEQGYSSVEELEDTYTRSTVEVNLLYEKVMAFLKENAVIS